jgi:hypothetical protein
MKYFLLLMPAMTLFGCATKIPPPTVYTYDVYQYKLESQDFARLQKEIKSTNKNPDLFVVNYENYWKLVEKLEQESFFATYKYSSINCKISESGSLSIQHKACTYDYSDKNLMLNLTANNYKDNHISYNLMIQPTHERMSTYNTRYNSSKEYFFFTYKTSVENLFFIIYKNELNIPWDYYKNAPQQQIPR